MVNNWIESTVKELSTIFGRIGFRGYTKEDIVDPYEGAISLSPSNLKNGSIDISNSTFISWFKYDESPEIKLKNGDVVLVKTGSTYGKTAYVDNLTWKTTLNPQIVVFKNIKINNKLFSYFVQTPEFQKQIEATIVGGAIPTLSQNQVYQFKIFYPVDKQEQDCIADALSDVDAMISLLEKLIAKKKAVKQGAMQELLTGKKRLPGFTGEWEKKSFGDVFDFIPNNAFTRAEMSTNGTVKNIHYGDVLTKYGCWIDANDTDIPFLMEHINLDRFRAMCYLQTGDVIIANTAEDETVGKALEIINVTVSVLAGQHTLLCRSRIKFADKFLGYYLNADCYHSQLLPFIVGTKVSSISKASVAQTSICLPSIEEQTAIASILSDMDSEIEALEQKLEKAHQIKQGMMQQLLTGKIRLM